MIFRVRIIASHPKIRLRKTKMAFYGNGLFEFVSDKNHREMLINAHKAFTNTELWNWYATYTPSVYESYSLNTTTNMERVEKEMCKEAIGREHSGITAAWTLAQMKFIAVRGYDAYKKEVLRK